MNITFPLYDPATGTVTDVPANEKTVQAVVNYLFSPRLMGRIPWLDDPDTFERRRRQWKAQMPLEGAEPERARKTWQEVAYALRQGADAMSWDAIASHVGQHRLVVVQAVKQMEQQRAATS